MAELSALTRAACVIAVVLLTGCTGTSADPSPSPSIDPAFTELIESELARAVDAGADSAQIALLEEARDAGLMSHELALQGVQNYIECLDVIGIKAELEDSQPAGDFPDIRYRVYTPDITVAEPCLVKTYDFVDSVYQLQPASHASGEATLAEHADQIIECLKDAGADIPDDVDVDLIASAALSVSLGMQPFNEDPLPNGPVDCLGPLGLDLDDVS